MIVEIGSPENAHRDLTSQVAVLTKTPDASNPMLCQGLIFLGDGAEVLDGSGGDFEYTVTVDGVVIEPDPQVVAHSTATATAIWTKQFPVPANAEVILKVKSPNGADTVVDTVAHLYQVDAVDVVAVAGVPAAAEALMFEGGAVWVDSGGTASTAFPYGSAPFPTDTIARGKTIADAYGIRNLRLHGALSLAAAMEHYDFSNEGHIDIADLVDINSQSIEHSTLTGLVITGIGGNAALVGDQTRYLDCLLYAHTNIQGEVRDGGMGGACSIRDTGYALLTDVFFGEGAACTLTLQAPSQCDIVNMCGTLTIAGMDGGTANISMTHGAVLILNNTNTAGTLTVTGHGTLTDNSNGTAVVRTVPIANAIEISGDSGAADALETMLDGTGGQTFSLGALVISGSAAGGVVDIDNSGGPGVKIDGTTFGLDVDASGGPAATFTSGGSGGAGIVATGNAGGAGLDINGGLTGIGVDIDGGGTSGAGVDIRATSGKAMYIASFGGSVPAIHILSTAGGVEIDAGANDAGVFITGYGSGAGVKIVAGSTGIGLDINATAGSAVDLTTAAGAALLLSGTTYGAQVSASAGPGTRIAGTTYGLQLTASNGPAMSAVSTGGDGDGIVATKHGTGEDINADLTWNAAWDTEVQSEVNDALVAVNLDHFIETASTVNDAGATVIEFDTNLTEASNDHYNNMTVLFISGALKGQQRRISDYVGASKNITVAPALTEAPANGVGFVIIPNYLAVTLGAGSIEASTFATDAVNRIADHVLRRTTANVETSSYGDTLSFRSLYGAVAKLVHYCNISGTTLTVRKSDDSSVVGTQTVTSDAAADPVTGLETD